MKRKLIKGALYNPSSYNFHRVREIERTDALGLPRADHDVTDYAGVWDRAVENMRRVDSEGIAGLALMRMRKFKEGSEQYKRLGEIHKEYMSLPDEKKIFPEINISYRERVMSVK